MTSILERANRWRFQRAVASVLATPPVRAGDADFAALSMVRGRDTLAYLLAIKSFARHARPRRIIVIADPTLEDRQKRLIRSHAPAVEILDCAAFRRPALPVGGTWERLSAISTLNAECALVQLDADTVTFDTPSEVVRAIASGASFILRSEGGAQITDLETASTTGRRALSQSHHIQVAAEARLIELADGEGLRYVRGCSGFTGFGRGALSPGRLDDISLQMRRMHGARWDEWGSEQVTSNLLAASAPGAFMLPHPRYCNADSQTAASVFTHYIGYARFKSRDYELRARKVARELARGGEGGRPASGWRNALVRT